MPMPAEYHENCSIHENTNFDLGVYQNTKVMTNNMYRVGGKLYIFVSLKKFNTIFYLYFIQAELCLMNFEYLFFLIFHIDKKKKVTSTLKKKQEFCSTYKKIQHKIFLYLIIQHKKKSLNTQCRKIKLLYTNCIFSTE